MPEIPRVSGKEAIKAFEKAGFSCVRIKSSHHILKKEGHRYLLSVPVHGSKTLGVGLLSSLISNSGLTVEQFCDLL